MVEVQRNDATVRLFVDGHLVDIFETSEDTWSWFDEWVADRGGQDEWLDRCGSGERVRATDTTLDRVWNAR